MSSEKELAEAFASGMAIVALEDAFLDLIDLLMRDDRLRAEEVLELKHLHLARFDVAQSAARLPKAYAEALEGRRERLEVSWNKKLGAL